jgi:hypothetical protein
MSKIIYKFSLEIKYEQELEMPFGSEIIKIDTQLGDEKIFTVPLLRLWCICPVDSTKVKRKFIVIETGKEFESSDSLKFIGTVIFKTGNYVCHVFEKT